MANNGFERGTNCFAVVLSACEAPGQWEVALWLLDQMKLEGVRPSTACMNSAIATCLKGELLGAGWGWGREGRRREGEGKGCDCMMISLGCPGNTSVAAGSTVFAHRFAATAFTGCW
jgi:hypothetical protein